MDVTFKYNRNKAAQVVDWFIKKHNGQIDKIKLLKLVFLADRLHFVRYGRPIIGGDYVAMDHGPVLSPLYNEIRESSQYQTSRYSIKKSPLDFDETNFSQSDLKTLQKINNRFGNWDRWRLRDYTHTLNAYKKNKPEEKSMKPIFFEDFFEDEEDKSILAIVRDHQEAFAGLL